MRELKFRIWHSDKMWEPFAIETLIEQLKTCGEGLQSPDNGIYMQSTGIKDREGNEVFEGDVVVWPHLDSEGYHEIYFNEKELQYSARPLTIHDEIDSCLDSTHMKVVGNIYQNPELLK